MKGGARFLTALGAFPALFLFQPLSFADTLHLKNGNTVQGIIENETPETVDVNLGFGSATFLKKEIARIEKSDAAGSQALWTQWAERKKEEERRRPEEEKRRKERELEAERLQQEEERFRKEKDEYAAKEVRVETQNGHFFVPLLLNGKVRVKLMLDSGASFVTLSSRAAAALGIDVHQLKEASMRVADGRVVKTGQASLESVEVLSLGDKAGEFSASGAKLGKVDAYFLMRDNDIIVETPDKIRVPDDGLLGMSFLKHFEFKLDYAGQKIVFQKNREA